MFDWSRFDLLPDWRHWWQTRLRDKRLRSVVGMFFLALFAFAALAALIALVEDRKTLGLVLLTFEAINNFISSLPAAVGGGGVLAALVLAIIALLVAGGVSDRVEELTEQIARIWSSGSRKDLPPRNWTAFDLRM